MTENDSPSEDGFDFFTLEQEQLLERLESGQAAEPADVYRLFPGVHFTLDEDQFSLVAMHEAEANVRSFAASLQIAKSAAFSLWKVLLFMAAFIEYEILARSSVSVHASLWWMSAILLGVFTMGMVALTLGECLVGAFRFRHRRALRELSSQIRSAWWAAAVCRVEPPAVEAAIRIIQDTECKHALDADPEFTAVKPPAQSAQNSPSSPPPV